MTKCFYSNVLLKKFVLKWLIAKFAKFDIFYFSNKQDVQYSNQADKADYTIHFISIH